MFQWKSFHMTVRKIRQKQFQVSNFVLLLLVFKLHHGSEGVTNTHHCRPCNMLTEPSPWQKEEREGTNSTPCPLSQLLAPISHWRMKPPWQFEWVLPTTICSAPSLELFKSRLDSSLHTLLLVPTFPWTATSCNYGFNVRSSITAGSQQTCHLGGKNGSCPSMDPQSVWHSAGR